MPMMSSGSDSRHVEGRRAAGQWSGGMMAGSGRFSRAENCGAFRFRVACMKKMESQGVSDV